jgi:hypothetical protein
MASFNWKDGWMDGWMDGLQIAKAIFFQEMKPSGRCKLRWEILNYYTFSTIFCGIMIL